jgi:hypothetical protein
VKIIQSIELQALADVISASKSVAKQYRQITGRPLGITGEVAEYEAPRLLGLRLADVRQEGFDAMRVDGDHVVKLQIKSRCVPGKSRSGARLGSIKLDKDWDAVLLVMMDFDFNPIEIYEAGRADIAEALTKPGSISRNERGALSISKFKSIGERVWYSGT